MGFLKWILILSVIGILIWAFLPTGTLGGQELYDVEVSARINQSKSLGVITLGLLNDYNIDNVKYRVIGVSRNVDWTSPFDIISGEDVETEFCIMEKCQIEREKMTQWLGEQVTETEVISHVPKGNHTLKITVYENGKVKATHSEVITV